jgi:hypothetical protein
MHGGSGFVLYVIVISLNVGLTVESVVLRYALYLKNLPVAPDQMA